MLGTYSEDELYEDLIPGHGRHRSTIFAQLCIDRLRGAPVWMEQNGVRWQPAMRGLLHRKDQPLFPRWG